MQVNCSNCNSNYSVSEREMRALDHSVMTCKKCKRYIKITFCPHCKSFYSITYASVDQAQYNFRCRRCMSYFTVDFPGGNGAVADAKAGVTGRSGLQSPAGAPAGAEAPAAGTKSGMERDGRRDVEQAGSAIVFQSVTFSALNLRELFAVSRQAFAPLRVLVSSAGVLFMAMALFLFSGIESAFFSRAITREYPYLRSVFNLFPASILFFFFIITSAVVSKSTLEKLFHGRDSGLAGALGFAARIFGSVFLSNALILVAVNTLFMLLSGIPVVGPIIFSLVFLPLYAVSFILLILVLLGFWFYPPIIAHRDTGTGANIRNFYHFIRKHNMTLLYVVPILGISTLIIFSGIYFLHFSSLSLAVIFAKGFSTESVLKLFSSIPVPLLKLSEPSLLGADMGLFKSLLNGIESSHSIGGVVLGVLMALLSAVLLGAFISVVSTLSTHVYIVMERGVDVDDSRKIRLLVLLVLLLLAVFLFKALFVKS